MKLLTTALKALPMLAILGYSGTSLAQSAIRMSLNCTLPNSTATYTCAKDVAYGSHDLQKLDVWLPKTRSLNNPLVVYIHGGGYYQGDKDDIHGRLSAVKIDRLLKAGMVVASINYRLTPDFPFLTGMSDPIQMTDSARAIQFLKYNSRQLRFDKSKVALAGVSAGGGISLWLTLRTDLRNPNASDVIARESTRVQCTALQDMQPTLNLGEVRQLFPQPVLGEGLPGFYGISLSEYMSQPDNYDYFLSSLYAQASPMSHLTYDDQGKILMTYLFGLGRNDIHSPEFGIYLAEGTPTRVKNQYGRLALRDVPSIQYELLYGQTPQAVVTRTNQFLINECF